MVEEIDTPFRFTRPLVHSQLRCCELQTLKRERERERVVGWVFTLSLTRIVFGCVLFQFQIVVRGSWSEVVSDSNCSIPSPSIVIFFSITIMSLCFFSSLFLTTSDSYLTLPCYVVACAGLWRRIRLLSSKRSNQVVNLVSKNTLNATLHHSTRHLFKRSSRDDELFLFQFLSDFLNCDHEKVKKKKKKQLQNLAEVVDS